MVSLVRPTLAGPQTHTGAARSRRRVVVKALKGIQYLIERDGSLGSWWVPEGRCGFAGTGI